MSMMTIIVAKMAAAKWYGEREGETDADEAANMRA